MDPIELHRFHSDLVEKFQASEESGDTSRRKAERDIDYYDGKQWTEKEVKELRRRGQPAISMNLIRQKVDFLQGLERNQRTVPNALPRTPQHEQDAHAVKDALRYVADLNRYDEQRSRAWKDILTAGWGGMEVVVEERAPTRQELMASTSMGMEPQPYYDVRVRRCQWDRMFWDPYSAEEDFSDAAYLGMVIWMDRDEAVRRYGAEAGKVFDDTVAATSITSTFDDRPKTPWVSNDRRRRVRVVQMYFIDEDGEWSFCEFTKGGLLQYGPSPFETEDGEREHPYSWRSAYVDRENNRYGVIRDLIDPQDEANKRRSKALHHFTVRQTYGNKRALGDLSARELRQQLARPDGHIELTGEATFGQDFGIIPANDQAAGHFELLQQAMGIFEVMGPNASMMGKKDGNESGRAIMAQQQGGAVQMGTLTETLREMDLEVYRKVWRRVRQFWSGQTWVRVTDDLNNLKFVALNEPQMEPVMQPVFDPATGAMDEQPMIDPGTGEPAMQPVIDPATGQPIMQNHVSELDVDIEIDDAPDMGTLQQEEFSQLIELAGFGIRFPDKVYLAASNLRNKGELIEMMDEAAQQQAEPPPEAQAALMLELQGKEAENAEKSASAMLKQAQAAKAMSDAQAGRTMPVAPSAPAVDPAKMAETEARTIKTMAEARKIAMETDLLPLQRLAPQKTTASVTV